jgi:hypothetical protein
MKAKTLSLPAVVLAALVGTVLVLAQPPRPTAAIQLSASTDVRFPSNVSQCDQVLIFYDRATATNTALLGIYAPGDLAATDRLISMVVPTGIGYLDWACNIPAGHNFAVHFDLWQYIAVQSGRSECLGNVTTTYEFVSYATPLFQSYTANPPRTDAPTVSLASVTFVFLPCLLSN